MSEFALFFWSALAVTTLGGAAAYYQFHRTRYRTPLPGEDPQKNAPAPGEYDGVNDPKEAAEMFLDIQRRMACTFGFVLSTPISARLASGPEIQRRMRSPIGEQAALGLCSVEEGKVIIYIQRGLPRAVFYATLAHEFAHAWQRLDGFMPSELERCEGFAEWVALVLTEMAGFDVTEFFKRPPWDPCGSGMRRFAAFEELYGVKRTAQLGKRPRFNFKFLRGDYKSSRGTQSSSMNK